MPSAWLLAHLFFQVCAASTEHRIAEIDSGGELTSDSAHEHRGEDARRLQHDSSIGLHKVEISSTGHLEQSGDSQGSSSSSSPHEASARKREVQLRHRNGASQLIRREAQPHHSHTSRHSAHDSLHNDDSAEGTLHFSLDEEELGKMPRSKRNVLNDTFLDEEQLDSEDETLLDVLMQGAIHSSNSAVPRRRRVPCTWQEWTGWGLCSTTCGSGSYTRYRGMNMAQYGGTACHGDTVQAGSCHPSHCPIHCRWGEWSGLTPATCPVTCGGCIQVTSRSKIASPAYGGTDCDDPDMSSLHVDCNAQSCPIDCDFSAWTAWTSCSLSCGVGMQQRSRDKTHSTEHGGALCPGNAAETRQCNIHHCSVDCGVGSWIEWDQCTEDCGGGKTQRHRPLLVPVQHGGEPCPHLKETEECNESPCAALKAEGRTMSKLSGVFHLFVTTAAMLYMKG